MIVKKTGIVICQHSI